MVNALISFDENTNRILNIVKARHGLRDKGQAVEFVVKEFANQSAEPGLRDDFIQKMNEIERQKSIVVENFSERYF